MTDAIWRANLRRLVNDNDWSEARMTDDVSKLPPMPTDAQIMEFGPQWGDNRRIVYYRVRMEALVDVMKALDRVASGQRDYDVSLAREVSALLAACGRKEG